MPAHSAAIQARGRTLPVSGALQAVRSATRDTHDALDALLPHGLRRLHDYRRYLGALLPLADWLVRGWRAGWPDHLGSWHAPQRLAHLRQDIDALDRAPDARAHVPGPLPSPRAIAAGSTAATAGATPASWLGGCYVIEGSALGARILARDLDGLALEHPGVAGARRFIDQLTLDPGRWRRFTQVLDALPADDIGAATSGACAGFALVHAGLAGQGDTP